MSYSKLPRPLPGFVHSEFRKLLRPKVIALATLFCLGQLFQELIAEAIFTRYEFPRSSHEVAITYGLFQQLGAVLVALLFSQQQQQQAGPPPPMKQHDNNALSKPNTRIALCALTALIFASSVFPNLALNYVHFPAKVVAKSTKLVPTMMVSVMVGNSQRFSYIDYISALLLCCGAVVFAFSSTKENDAVDSSTPIKSAYLGLCLLSIASLADALVPNIQQMLMQTKSVRSAEELAFLVNALGSTAMFLYLFAYEQAAMAWVEIFFKEPVTLVLLLAASVCSGVFVVAYTKLIQEAGSVVAMAVATARKVLTLTLSYLVFPGKGKEFTSLHMLSALAVGLGMALGPLWERYMTATTRISAQEDRA